MKIFLINSGNDAGIADITNQFAYPPLSIISLGTVLENHFADRIELTLFDGQVDAQSDILDQIRIEKPGLVGVSMYLTSVRNAVELITTAKEVGSITIMGNDHAAFHAKALLTRVPELDFVCLNDVGEETIVPLVATLLDKKDISSVPQLMYRHHNKLFQTQSATGAEVLTLNAIAIPNRRLLSDRYWSEYANRFHSQNRIFSRFNGNERVSTINRARGCAQKKNPCRYCGIADLSIRYASPEVFWEDVRAARDQIGATVLYEAFDSASSVPSVLRRWRDHRPPDLDDTYLKMYAQAFESTPEKVQLFKELNVFCINMGLDSGDDHVLKLMKGERHSLDQNKRACSLYTDSGIEIYTSFVLLGLGSDSETARSLQRTVDFADWLVRETSTVSFDAAMFYPDKGAPIGRLVWYPEEAPETCARLGWNFINFDELNKVSKKWKSEIFIDANELCGDFARVCGTSRELLMDYWRELHAISNKAGMNFGGTGKRDTPQSPAVLGTGSGGTQ